MFLVIFFIKDITSDRKHGMQEERDHVNCFLKNLFLVSQKIGLSNLSLKLYLYQKYYLIPVYIYYKISCLLLKLFFQFLSTVFVKQGTLEKIILVF